MGRIGQDAVYPGPMTLNTQVHIQAKHTWAITAWPELDLHEKSHALTRPFSEFGSG